MYGNPYLQNFNPYQQIQQQPAQEVVKVNGENGARAYPMGANSSALLLDSSGLLVWLVTTDGAGYKTVSPYDITPHQAAPAPDYNSLEQRISRLEGMIHESTSNPSAARTEHSYAKSEFSTNPESGSNHKEREKSSGFFAADAGSEKSSAAASNGLCAEERRRS